MAGRSAIKPTNQFLPDAGVVPTEMVVITPETAKLLNARGVDTAIRANQIATGVTTSVSQNRQSVKSLLASKGVNFSPESNPLNQYANYTYHIRWSLTSEQSAYSISKSNPSLEGVKKTVIAESGVTAGFNITELELKNTCGMQSATLNTSAYLFTMTVLEPFGISLLDKIRSAAATQPVVNHMRCPFFLEVWFNGYDEDGNIIAPNEFYQLYRIGLSKMEVTMTEAGSRYTIEGYMDNELGNTNQISIPPAMIAVRADTVGSFFDQFGQKLTENQKTVSEQNFATIEYEFNVPPEIRSWTLRDSKVDEQNNRSDDMDIKWSNGVLEVKINRGMAVENVINLVMSMSPEAEKWLKGNTNGGTAGGSSGDLENAGLATWIMIHSDVEIIGFDVYTRDYIRKVKYSLVPYKTITSGADKPTITRLEERSVQVEKLNYLSNKNSMKKLYEYIYTGQNTEVIKFDIRVDNLWGIALPMWEATNNYDNYAQGYKYSPEAVANLKRKSGYNKKKFISDLQGRLTELKSTLVPTGSATERQIDQNLAEQAAIQDEINRLELSQISAVYFRNDLSPGALAADSALLKRSPEAAETITRLSTSSQMARELRYAEDLKTLPAGPIDPLPVVLRPDNRPMEQNANVGSDSNKAIADQSSYGIPGSRGLIGTILGNMFSMSAFMQIELEIRGDPYWMGQSNIRQNSIAESFGEDRGDPNFASYLLNDHMLILTFRSGENYNEETGLMDFSTTSEFFNGAYSVWNVTNSFKNGSFTQILTCGKDVFAQKVNPSDDAEKSASTPSSSSSTVAPVDRAAAATAAGTSEALVTEGGQAFGGGGL